MKILTYARILFFSFTLHLSAAGFPPSYYAIEDTQEQKRVFIETMHTMIEQSNGKIMEERAFVTSFFAKMVPGAFRGLNQQNIGYLIALRNRYGIENLFDREAYYKHIDAIPASLAIAQAALESGWGKSRFAREANNLFGHWTYSGVGLMPKNRLDGKSHMIRIYASLQKSVDGYMYNLNTNKAYALFRDRRAAFRQKEKLFSGLEAVKTMIHYSELKEAYIEMVQEMIVNNQLMVYDKRY